MYFCVLATSDGTNIIGFQYSSVELFNVGNPPPTTIAQALTICQTNNASSDVVNGAFSYSSDNQTLQNLFDNYLSFDASIFDSILGYGLAIFIAGYAAGVVAKLLTRQNSSHY
jgi:hypothetical protein